MNKWLTLVPGYGRDYETAEAVLQAWKELKDFLIQDVSCKYTGKYINVQDAERFPELAGTTFKIRFSQKAEYALIKKEGENWVLSGRSDTDENSVREEEGC